MPPEVVVAALLAALGGALVGGVLATRAARRGSGVAPEAAGGALAPSPQHLPAGVAGLLAAVGGPALVLGASDEVVGSTPAARALGLVRGRELTEPVLQDAVRAARREHRVQELERELPERAPSSARHLLAVRVAPLVEDHVMLLATDRTDARRLEQVRRDFVVNVSHELKTPVGSLGLLAEAVQDAADDPVAVRRFAGRMHRESQRLALLVHDVVELSRLQDGVPLTRTGAVDVDEVVDEAVDRCRLSAETRGIGLDVAADSGARVLGDAELLTTAVRNLVDNAVRYSEPGTRVGVGVALAADSVEVAVTDQGIGIGPADLDRVFERFYRVDPARSRATGGTGLGLSIVKHVAAGHGGDVRLWSQVGHGSTFTLRLPVAGPPALPRVPAPATTAEPAAPVEEEHHR